MRISSFSLKNKKEAAAYLQVALGEYQSDGDIKAFLTALPHVAEAQGGIGMLSRKTHRLIEEGF